MKEFDPDLFSSYVTQSIKERCEALGVKFVKRMPRKLKKSIKRQFAKDKDESWARRAMLAHDQALVALREQMRQVFMNLVSPSAQAATRKTPAR